jgi:hypothetical protein
MKIMPTRVFRSPFTGTGTVYLCIIYLFVSPVKVITARKFAESSFLSNTNIVSFQILAKNY